MGAKIRRKINSSYLHNYMWMSYHNKPFLFHKIGGIYSKLLSFNLTRFLAQIVGDTTTVQQNFGIYWFN